MSRQRALIYSFSFLITLLLVSCSPPAGDLESKKSASAASTQPPANSSSVVEAAPAEPSKPVEAPKKQQAEAAKPAQAPANRHIKIPAEAATPAPAPTPAPQQTASNEPTSAAIALPAPQTQITAPTPPPPPPPPQPTTKHFTIPAGTEVYVRTIDAVDTETGHPNQTFRASLDKDIVADNQTVFPRRSDVFLKIIEVQSAGKLSGQSELKVQLDRLFIGKDPYTVTSNTFEQTGASEGKKAARNVGIGAAAGAILGGILGGGKGAVIGAGAGGGGGAVLSKGEQVKIASETQLMFKLENPLDVTITIPPPGAAVAASSAGPARLIPPDRPVSQGQTSSFDDVSGNWTVTTSGQQYMTLQLSLRQNGNNLQGSITDPQGYGTLPIRGSVNGNYLNFYTQSQYGTNSMQMQFTGALQGGSDRMQGNVTMPAYNNGNVGGYPGGGGYPRRGGQGRAQTTQARWTAQRN
jgi:hypothetical protein